MFKIPHICLFCFAGFLASFQLHAITSGNWTDPRDFLAISDGTHSLGDLGLPFNNTRDQGSKIVFFDSQNGNNDTADYYWWDGNQIVDSNGSTTNPDNGLAYGTDVLHPNEEAIRPYSACLADQYPGIKTQAGHGGPNGWRFSKLAGGYPDFFLFRRGQVHSKFDCRFAGGRSETEPMVVAAYGPVEDGRAIQDSEEGYANPFNGHNWGRPQSWMHQAVFSFEIRGSYGYLNTHVADTFAEGGGPTTAFLEDCYFPGREGGIITYPPKKTTLRRCILTHCWKASSHNQAYFTSGYENQVTFDEVIFYKNGYKEDPRIHCDPRRDIFSRNVYQGGGARMGHIYRNVISMDGASGGPQMRLGGLMENSLILEGYFYSSTESNGNINEWARDYGQIGRSAIVRNNVQLVFSSNSPADPDLNSDNRSQPGWGYGLSGFSFGAIVEGNIISGAMLADDLGKDALYGFSITFRNFTFPDGTTLYQKNNRVSNNIAYRVREGFKFEGDPEGATDITLENNIAVSDKPLNINHLDLASIPGLSIASNRFYSDSELVDDPVVAASNTLAAYDQAATTEDWPDPDRTLKRYVTEVLGLTLLDWDDDPFKLSAEVDARKDAGELYDPAAMRTFMAVATNMRHGGKDTIPTSGKPSLTADYPWDDRFTAIAVVNWIRAGFNLPSVDETPAAPAWDVGQLRRLRFRNATTRALGLAITNTHPSAQHFLQSSDDLTNWTDYRELQADNGGTVQCEIPKELEAGKQRTFYRLTSRSEP